MAKKNNYPLALLTAAHILKATPTKDEKQEKVVEGIPAGDQNQETGKVDTPDEMLAMAKTLVEGKDMAMVAMIDNEMKTGGTKGSTSGPIAHKDRVRGGMTDTYTIKFRGDEKAMIGIIGDDRADLDLFVYDQGGHLIRSDESSSSDCAFDWTPAWTGTYTVKVKNSGTRSSEYLLLTN